MPDAPQIYLASASPRRRILLEQIGVRFDLISLDLEEDRLADEAPEAYVGRVALDKARAGWQALDNRPARPVLGADTAVVLDGDVLGKPQDQAHARAMLEALSGRTHEVLSAVAVVAGEREEVVVQTSRVSMRPIADAEIDAYWSSGEPKGKAGGYAVQGLGAVFIAYLQGSYSGVMGLPLFETAELLRQFDVHVLTAP